jgi:anti-sigma factor RsiW
MSHECQRLLELLHDFVSGELAPAELASLQSHLRGCPPCEIYVQTYRLTITMTRALPPAEIPSATAQRLLQVLKRECSES